MLAQRRVLLILCLLSASAADRLVAQSDVTGLVVDSATRLGIAQATVQVGPGAVVRADSIGRYRIAGLPAGEHVVRVAAPGFTDARIQLEVRANETLVRDFVLSRRAQTLAGTSVIVTTPVSARTEAILERRKAGAGHLITRAQLERAEGMKRTGDLISLIPGVAVKRGSSKAWIASGRAANPAGGCAFCRGGKLGPVPKWPSASDVSEGARPACYMDVYLDGVLVFDSTQPESGLFDVNSIQPSQLEAIELYPSAGQIPAQYNKTSNGCGVMLLWLRY